MQRAAILESHLPHVPGSRFTVQSAQSAVAPPQVVPMSTLEKALSVNLDQTKYGVFCEVGAGQEVVRHFFLAGGASGTIAKSMSAYDKDVSDAIYGQEPNKRYVTRGRLEKMLEREYELLVDRMPNGRAKKTQYFVFADTVAARSFRGGGECHGWVGIRAQLYPESEPSQLVLHVRMRDKFNAQQAEALGVLGVNLVYAMFYLKREGPYKIIDSLLDSVGRDRLEIDQCHLSGSFFDADPRLVALHLVTSGLTHAVMFDSTGSVANVSETLYKKDVLVLRGRFRPVTRVACDMRVAAEAMMQEQGGSILTLAEVTTRNLVSSGGNAKGVDPKDFLSRVDVLCSLGFSVVVSDFLRFFRLREYLGRYTRRRAWFCMSVFNVVDLFKESFYEGMEGGVLEAMGRLFSGDVRLLVYPRLDPDHPTQLIGADDLFVTDGKSTEAARSLAHLYLFLRQRSRILPVLGYDPSVLTIDTSSVVDDLQRGGTRWEHAVPTGAVALIKEKKLFGFNSW